jgi:hypothetical protein
VLLCPQPVVPGGDPLLTGNLLCYLPIEPRVHSIRTVTVLRAQCREVKDGGDLFSFDDRLQSLGILLRIWGIADRLTDRLIGVPQVEAEVTDRNLLLLQAFNHLFELLPVESPDELGVVPPVGVPPPQRGRERSLSRLGTLFPAPCKEKVTQAHQCRGEILTKSKGRLDLRPCGKGIDRSVQPPPHPIRDPDQRARQEVVRRSDRYGPSLREADERGEGLRGKFPRSLAEFDRRPVAPWVFIP